MSQTPTEPTTTEIMGKVVEAVAAVQDAEQTVVAEGQRLVHHMADPAAHGTGGRQHRSRHAEAGMGRHDAEIYQRGGNH